ncbi:uncharacterized protein EDB93DRAFT_1145655 [Suillus bovinus]|uniref:uncharacterized protein n=1 Tax=Suillus bovinus TaxID=48563 RepID=UPI001B860269|nr:uncharacterized protein EDB93DRAFT_1145655 [Suillus bovinus]KAG2147834.1 hypothetical protein EDB93DRAFT_1145655 [Suillus bovinus]
MRFSLLAVVVALTAAMFVSACLEDNQNCNPNATNPVLECCKGHSCGVFGIQPHYSPACLRVKIGSVTSLTNIENGNGNRRGTS